MRVRARARAIRMVALLVCSLDIAGVAAAESDSKPPPVTNKQTDIDRVPEKFEDHDADDRYSLPTLRSDQRGRIFEFWFPDRHKDVEGARRAPVKRQRDDRRKSRRQPSVNDKW